jgi:hypothetical protein
MVHTQECACLSHVHVCAVSCVHMCVWCFAHTHVMHVHICLRVFVWVCVCEHWHAYACVHVYIRMCTHTFMLVCMCVLVWQKGGVEESPGQLPTVATSSACNRPENLSVTVKM